MAQEIHACFGVVGKASSFAGSMGFADHDPHGATTHFLCEIREFQADP